MSQVTMGIEITVVLIYNVPQQGGIVTRLIELTFHFHLALSFQGIILKGISSFLEESTEAYQQRSTVPLKEINLRKGENRTVNLWCFKKLCSKIIHLYFKHKKNAHNSGELRYSKYICTYRQGKDHTLYYQQAPHCQKEGCFVFMNRTGPIRVR